MHTIAQRILLYGAETWTRKQNYKREPFVTEMEYLKRSIRIYRKDKIKYSIIRKDMGQKIQEIEEMNFDVGAYHEERGYDFK